MTSLYNVFWRGVKNRGKFDDKQHTSREQYIMQEKCGHTPQISMVFEWNCGTLELGWIFCADYLLDPKKAPRIWKKISMTLLFTIILKTIEIWVPSFFMHNIFSTTGVILRSKKVTTWVRGQNVAQKVVKSFMDGTFHQNSQGTSHSKILRSYRVSSYIGCNYNFAQTFPHVCKTVR